MAKNIIVGKRIILKPFILKDAKILAELANDRTIHRFTRVPYPYALKDARDFIKKCIKKLKSESEFNYGIYLKDTKELIGTIGFVRIEKRDKHAEIGYWIGKKYRNKGYMTEAARLLVDYGFRKLKFHRIEITCCTKNKASERIIKDKLKAKFEGILRKRAWVNNKWHDQEIFSILVEEYPKIKRKWR